MIALGIILCLAITILFSLLPLFLKVEERKIISIAFIVIFIGVFIYSAGIDASGAGFHEGKFIRFVGIISSYVGLFINSLMLVNSLKITGGKTIVSMVYLLIIPLGFVVEDAIAEKKFNHLCETEAGLTIYEKIYLPKEYFHEANEREIKGGFGKKGEFVANVQGVGKIQNYDKLKENHVYSFGSKNKMQRNFVRTNLSNEQFSSRYFLFYEIININHGSYRENIMLYADAKTDNLYARGVEYDFLGGYWAQALGFEKNKKCGNSYISISDFIKFENNEGK